MKLVKDDAPPVEDKIQLKMGFTNDKKKIVIDFGKPIQTIFFDMDESASLIKGISDIMAHINKPEGEIVQ